MSHVVIIRDTGILKKYLRKIPVSGTKKRYLCLEEERTDSGVLLEKEGFLEIMPPQINDEFKKEFLLEYVNLVGSLGREFNSRRWWGTDIASKNRFTSDLPYQLHQFIKVVQVLRIEDFDVLIIFNPPRHIVIALKEFLRKNGIKHDCLGGQVGVLAKVGLQISRRILAVLYNIVKISILTFYAKAQLIESIKEMSSARVPFYVVKTFVYNHSFSENGSYKDVFFGTLPDYLKKNKKKLLIYAAILGNYRYCMVKIKQCREQVIIPVEALLSLTDILQAAVQILFCRFRVRKELLFFENEVNSIVNSLLIETFNGLQYYQFLHYWSTKRLLELCSVNTFLLTYENNPWEKMCMTAIQEYSPDTAIIGYQHTVVPLASANMFVSSKEKKIMPMPDKILTVGTAPKEIMERYGNYDNGEIETSCGLRFEYLFQTPAAHRSRTGNILLILEGIFEVYKMVNYVLKELKNHPRYKMTIRTHPVLPIERIRHKLETDLALITNLYISKEQSLRYDVEKSDVIVYWGTTAALEALSMGKPVIHFETGFALSYDPLFECRHLKWTVSEKDSLLKVIEEINSLPDEDFYQRQRQAKEYLSTYFHSITDKNLQKFILK